MRRLLLAAAAAASLAFAIAPQASAQQIDAASGMPIGGGVRPGGGGWGAGAAVNRGPGWNRPAGYYGRGSAWRGSGWRGGGWRGYPRYRHGGRYPYRGVGAGLAAAATIGALATYPPYAVYPDYGPAYPVYPAYQPEPVVAGDHCSTPVKMCTLYRPAQLGVGCSCKVAGGRARGTVVP
ncbi:hypothetical protein [Bosea sp. (in: a-proteobacteria)]|uniref:hypothetical protein n=1 Tax=Bosea sp. (in: a-proteobacteria) TaxID=1871050 RepID=UPI0012240A70|nr:hypothetical protein [Bosea sp. (in: a-proteobacteria)]TAJ31698.1 MAG: hypothetical protein EPO59_07550 [Bosea sp. (in: a-proteobacteria)]